MLGSAHDPIDLLAEDSGDDIGGDMSRATKRTRSGDKTSHCPMPRHGADQNRQYIFLDNDDEDGDEPPNALVRSLRRHPTAEDELIDLEDIEDVLLQADGQLLQLEGVYLDEAKSQDSRRSSRAVKIERRNPDIVFPFVRKESLKHLGSTILPNKTVELRDGSFMRITDVLLNTQTNAVTLRGHRLQRTRDMNGMLEKKMNECLLFLEVDDDDHRDPLKQAVFEIPLAEVVQLRNVRYTNEIFPLNRNLDLTDFNSKKMVQETGGLTARWKYTCHYISAISRHNNNYKERSLEHLEPDECTKGYATLKAARRFKWRGETVLGGAYQPTVDGKETIVLLESRGEENTISIASSPKAKNSALAQVYSIDDSLSDEEDRSNRACEKRLYINLAKRKHSEMAVDFSEQTSWCGQSKKKVKQAEEKALKETRERLSRMSLQPCQKKELGINSKPIDFSPRLSMPIDLTSSDLAAPPATGSLGTASGAPRRRTVRTAGQKLTYGDAFCGAGGATRGATMAGLRALWGFDHWEHACETWRANFPYATCYHEDAHGFVQFAKRFPHLVKVDILHLSPPCQFFSPAHTINGCDDEMNTASLFAVLDVIRVSKPRIVTLEQTFGICHPRFRFYFNALVHMFTAQDFSIRWAIIPLAQWVRPLFLVEDCS
jgi:DNA (cytosine-5)-methyltransferase 1